MSTKYKFIDKQGVYFTTSTVVGWADVFTRDVYRNILLDSVGQYSLLSEKSGIVCTCMPAGLDTSVGGINDQPSAFDLFFSCQTRTRSGA